VVIYMEKGLISAPFSVRDDMELTITG